MKDGKVFGFELKPLVLRGANGKGTGGSGKEPSLIGTVILGGSPMGDDKKSRALVQRFQLSPWQLALFEKKADSHFFQTPEGPLWWCASDGPAKEKKSGAQPVIGSPWEEMAKGPTSPYGRGRDSVGAAFRSAVEIGCHRLCVENLSRNRDLAFGAVMGLELAGYHFRSLSKAKKPARAIPQLVLTGFDGEILNAAAASGMSQNFCRHLVNLPAADLNPKTYADLLCRLFEDAPGFKVEVFDGLRLKKERMNLIAAVGGASMTPPCAVHIRYRGHSRKKSSKSIAIVGKGITFDSGGLDIKPASGMRYMKKDMAGSAAIAGLALWLKDQRPEVDVDLYLALAENSVGSRSYRPGDIFESRKGDTVEIHNTDAEGRLVMADLLDYATDERVHKVLPSVVMDLSTLTGAMRVALGEDIAGFFTTDPQATDKVLRVGARYAEGVWPMPLYKPYGAKLDSPVADVSNASDSPMAGAITAALFLQRFVRNNVPWLHFDFYGWTDKPRGPFGESGGNGHGVMLLIGLLEAVL